MKHRHGYLLFLIIIMLAFYIGNVFSQQKKDVVSIVAVSPDTFVKRILDFSSEQRRITLQKQIATKVRKLTYFKLFLPTFDLMIRPFGYDKAQLTAFEILQRNSVGANIEENKVFYNLGAGLRFAIPTPFGGRFETNINNFLFIKEGLKDYRQQIKFSFTLTQPLFVNSDLAEVGWFTSEKTLANREYSLQIIEATINQNMLIRKSYEQAYGIITLQKQKKLLERTIIVLEDDYVAMKIRRKNGIISDTVLQAFEITLNKKKQQYKKVKAEYENIRRIASYMTKMAPDTIYITIQKDNSRWEKHVFNTMPTRNEMQNNLQVKKSTMEYNIKSRSFYLENIADGPVINFDFSLQPQYPMRATERGFVASYADLFLDSASLDLRFTVSVLIPLLSSVEKKARQSVNSLALSVYKEEYVSVLDEAIRKMKKLYDDKAVQEKVLSNLELDIALQKAFLNEKKIQLSTGNASKQEVKRQELQVQEVDLRYWNEKSKYLLLIIDTLSNTGTDLIDIVR